MQIHSFVENLTLPVTCFPNSDLKRKHVESDLICE